MGECMRCQSNVLGDGVDGLPPGGWRGQSSQARPSSSPSGRPLKRGWSTLVLSVPGVALLLSPSQATSTPQTSSTNMSSDHSPLHIRTPLLYSSALSNQAGAYVRR